MRILAGITLLFNIMAIFALAISLFKTFENPKNKANYGYFVTACMIGYMFLLIGFIVAQVIFRHNLLIAGLFICVVSPFLVGKLVKYETLKLYTFVQMLFFSISLYALYLGCFN